LVSGMKVLVTGATGFVGSHVARQLADTGADLRLLVRPTSRKDNIASLRYEAVTGDLRDPESLVRAVSGCDYVFHVAADYRLWVRDSREMYKCNVDGTAALIAAAEAAGVKRVVYTSSVATMGFKTSGVAVTEEDPVSLNDMIGPYKRSKFMAEQVALKSPITVVLNPTTPIGEQDIKPTPTGRIVVDFMNGDFPAYVDTGLNLVDVREVARAHVAALESGKPGERYILGGEDLTLKQILDKLSAITGRPSPTMKVPHAVALGFAYFDTLVTGYISGKEPRATPDAVRMGRKKMFASSAKAERELGYRTASVDGALARAVEWFQGHGYVKARRAIHA
jgi:dihydroflavonol-4-reductase